MRKVDVSVIIVTYNRVNLLKRCLESLNNQNTRFIYEVLVVDNGSTDNTKKAVLDYGFRYYSVPQSVCRRPRNFAVAKANGEIIYFIDDDAYADSNLIQSVFTAFKESAPNVGVIGGRIENDSHGLVAEANHIFDFGNFYSNEEKEVRTVPTVNASYRRKVLIQFKFDQKVYIGEDADINWRIKKGGYILLYNPKIKVHHTSNNDLKKYFLKKVEQGEWFVKIRKKNRDMPLQIPSNYSILIFLLPFYIVASFFRSLNNVYLQRHFPQSFLTLPLSFLGILVFWISIAKNFKEKII